MAEKILTVKLPCIVSDTKNDAQEFFLQYASQKNFDFSDHTYTVGYTVMMPSIIIEDMPY